MSAEEAGTQPPVPSVDHLLQVAHGYAQRAAEQAELIGVDRVAGTRDPVALRAPAAMRLDAAARLSAFTRVADTFSVLAQTVALADAGDPVVRADTGWAQHVAGAVGVVSGDVYAAGEATNPHDPECESEYIEAAGHMPCQCERRATRARIARLAPQACAACRERDRGAVAVAGHGTCACQLECGAVSCAGKTPPAGSALEHYLARGDWPDGTKGRLRVIADPGTGS